MDARQVKDALNAQAEAVCRELVPAGKRERNEWVCGNMSGKEGKSFRVALSGSKVGVWADFAEAGVAGANLLDLWMQVRNLPFVEALKEAKRFLGLPDEPWEPVKTMRRVVGTKVEKSSTSTSTSSSTKKELRLEEVKQDGKVWVWLEARGLKEEAIRAYKVGEAHFEMDGAVRDFVVFPFFFEGKLVRIKFRDVDDKKRMFQSPGMDKAGQYVHGYQKLLFGWQAVKDDDRSVAITEGELDAMSCFQEGQPALSLPEGAQPKKGGDLGDSHKQWLEHDVPALDRFEEIILAMDRDAAGLAAQAALAPRLGIHRLKVLEFEDGCKDANEALIRDTLECALLSARELRPEDLKRPGDFAEAIWKEFFPEDEQKGYQLPWNMNFAFRPGELTIWQGWNSSGKTVCMSFCMVALAAKSGCRVCVASLEMPARKTFRNAMRQAMGYGRPWGGDEGMIRRTFAAALRWLDDRFWVYDKLGEVDVKDVIAVWEYAFRRYGVSHFILDSLMMLAGQGEADQRLYSNQREVVKALKDFAVQFNVHVHLVAHSKKPDSKKDSRKAWPSKFDISGAGNLSNIADNVVCVWRHEMKEEKLREAGFELGRPGVQADPESKQKWEAQIQQWKDREDSMFIVQKQRETGEMPSKRLYFDYGPDGSWQYLEEPDKKAGVKCYVPELEEEQAQVQGLRFTRFGSREG